MPVKPIPKGYRTVTPYLIVQGAAEALDFYKRALGAENGCGCRDRRARSCTPKSRLAIR
jgi:uncharacterized glyoxalase superfamily protein PhnB